MERRAWSRPRQDHCVLGVPIALLDHNCGSSTLSSTVSLNPAVCTERLKAFQEGNTPILLMSNVGTVGLNIAVANILIVVDNLWLAQETEQLVGRVWHHPQNKTVILYSIIADNTLDVFIVSLGSEKGLMHRRFMGQSTALERAMLTQKERAVRDAEDEEDEDEDPSRKRLQKQSRR
ncbi:hypothetical protein NUW54_g14477 [Trametes sanguinea]|uniref:Uncharacterized protein n=1 Tax=Trametes sanguinea TaxID=158606 RepID=A0ACC1MDW8_9APHY|nr:hypothetical protein NUW54_g14477 [Trametes sanguinea]